MNYPYSWKTLLLLVPILIFGLMVMNSCTDEKIVVEEKIVEIRDTIFVDIKMVVVDTINADPDSVAQGSDVVFTIQVTADPAVGPLTYNWFASGGTFEKDAGDTAIWKSPDEPGVYTITAHANDGSYIAMGSRMVGVGMYVPTVTPYYVGNETCMQCHSSTHDKWSMTGHAHAWTTLQESGNPQPSCQPCHSVGYEPSPNTGNSGYDEAAIEKFVNVQCENCHGAGSDHVASLNKADIEKNYDVQNCGKCHDGTFTHNNFLAEWQSSPHNFNPRTGSCAGCHEGVAASIRLSGEATSYPLNVFYGGGSISQRPDTSEAPLQPHVCQTCHDPHSVDNPKQLRTTADVPLVTANGESPVITEGGSGKLCMHCHHARRNGEPQIENGYPRFGPHGNPQADMAKGKSGYHGVADANFPWTGPSHLLVQNSCKTCHLNRQEYDGTTAITGHTFLPTVAACKGCHGPITDFDDIPARDDFDGNGLVEGVQTEVHGLIKLLQDALIADGLDTTGVGFEDALGDTTLSTYKQREAGWNLVFVESDKSSGVHNPEYAVQLLQQSIQYLTGNPVPNAAMVREENQVVGHW